jgi:Flp pilus assembly protein TadG
MNQMTRFKFKNFAAAESGVAAIEFAFIFPIMVLLFFCLIDFTGYVSYNRKIAAISGAVADLVSKNRNRVNADDIQKYFSVSGMILKPLAASNVKVRVIGYRNESGTAVKQWVVESPGAVTCSADPSTASMVSLMAASNDLVVAQTCMTYTPYIGSFFFNRAGHKFTNTLGPGTFRVEEVVTQRPRSSTTLDCYPTASSGTKCTKPAA